MQTDEPALVACEGNGGAHSRSTESFQLDSLTTSCYGIIEASYLYSLWFLRMSSDHNVSQFRHRVRYVFPAGCNVPDTIMFLKEKHNLKTYKVFQADCIMNSSIRGRTGLGLAWT